jgi:hypothetical protein
MLFLAISPFCFFVIFTSFLSFFWAFSLASNSHCFLFLFSFFWAFSLAPFFASFYIYFPSHLKIYK